MDSINNEKPIIHKSMAIWSGNLSVDPVLCPMVPTSGLLVKPRVNNNQLFVKKSNGLKVDPDDEQEI